MWNRRELKAVTRNAEMTGPETIAELPAVIRHAELLRLAEDVREANNRLVMTTAERDRAEISYNQKRHALARKMKEYGLLSLVDGQEPEPEREDE